MDKEKHEELFKELLEKIARSKDHILSLTDNWDEEGSKGYKEETFNQAMSFLRSISKNTWDVGIIIPNPDILPSQDGSIDLHWKNDKFELLNPSRFPPMSGAIPGQKSSSCHRLS